MISGNDFQLLVTLGHVSTDREDAAWALVKAFHYYGGVVHCISAIANHEIQTTRRPGRGAVWHRTRKRERSV